MYLNYCDKQTPVFSTVLYNHEHTTLQFYLKFSLEQQHATESRIKMPNVKFDQLQNKRCCRPPQHVSCMYLKLKRHQG